MGNLPEPGGPPPEGYYRGVDYFNRGEFFNCKDTLAKLWVASRGPEKEFYQGVIQVTSAFYQLSRRHYKGAVNLMASAVRHLAPYRPAYWGLDVERLIGESDRARETLLALGEDRQDEYNWGTRPYMHVEEAAAEEAVPAAAPGELDTPLVAYLNPPALPR